MAASSESGLNPPVILVEGKAGTADAWEENRSLMAHLSFRANRMQPFKQGAKTDR